MLLCAVHALQILLLTLRDSLLAISLRIEREM